MKTDLRLLIQQSNTNPNPVVIGARAPNNLNAIAHHFDGQIDEVRVWDYARTQAEIQADKDV